MSAPKSLIRCAFQNVAQQAGVRTTTHVYPLARANEALCIGGRFLAERRAGA